MVHNHNGGTDKSFKCGQNRLSLDRGMSVAISMGMNCKPSSIKNDFVIATLSSNMKLVAFLGVTLVLFGFFSPVVRQSIATVDSTDAINCVLGEQNPDPSN